MSSRYQTLREGGPGASQAAPPMPQLSAPQRNPNRVPAAVVERISTKVQAALWLVGALLVFFKGGVYEAAADPSRSLPFFIYLGLAALTLSTVLMVYGVVVIPRLYGSQWSWDVVAPGLNELGALSFVTALVSFIVGLWPGFGLLTPLVVGFMAMGCILGLHFIPFQ